MRRVNKSFSRILPRGMIYKAREMFIYAGISEEPEVLLGGSAFLGLMVGSLLFLLLGDIIHPRILSILFVPIGMYSLPLVVYGIISYIADKRAIAAVESLPDLLQLVASNVESGMTVEHSLYYAGRKEFGEIGRKIRLLSSAMFAGLSIKDCLHALARSFKSPIIQRAVDLILTGVRYGGITGDLFESVAFDIRIYQALHREAVLTIQQYILFLLVIALIISPLLFATSLYLLKMMNNLKQEMAESIAVDERELQRALAQIGGPAQLSMMMIKMITAKDIAGMTVNDLEFVVRVVIIANSFMYAVAIGLIKRGSMKEGVKMGIPIAIAAYTVFEISYLVISKYLITMF